MYCPNCKTKYPTGHKFCSTCEDKNGMPIRLIKDPSTNAGGFNLNLGDANAISGGINLNDSHEDKSQHYDQRGQTNYSAQGNVNITNQQVAAQKSAREVDLLHQQEGRQRYSDACRRFYENDGVIDAYEEKELTKIQVEYDLEINWCQQEKERINALLRDNNILSKSAKYDLEDLINAIKDNDKSKAATYASRLASLIKEKNHEELQYFYHLTLATLQPEKCTSEFEKSQSRNYWHTFWSYLAYLKQNKIDKAREVHNSLDAYRSYPEDNDMLIRTAGECILGDSSAKRDFARIDEGYSPVLRDLYNSIAIIVRPDIAQREGLAEKDYLFYLKNIFNFETEARLNAEEEEARALAEENRKKEELRLKRESEERAISETKRKAEELYLKGMNYASAVHGKKPDFENAFKLFLQSAEMGNMQAMFEVGVYYDNGRSVEEDKAIAMYWYDKAIEEALPMAKAGDLDFMAFVAKCWANHFFDSIPGAPDDVTVGRNMFQWAQEPAKKGRPIAQTILGDCYYNGYGVKEDEYEAIKWYRLAAEQGNAEAQDQLGDCYYNGYGVKEDENEAIKWYRLAAEQGNAEAQDQLGDYYLYGDSRDEAMAFKWFKLAAEQGNSHAQGQVGFCYDGGIGVEKSRTEAIKWLTLAAGQGNEDAEYLLEKLKEEEVEERKQKTVPQQNKSVQEETSQVKPSKWVCPVCGYSKVDIIAPSRCPQCKIPGTKFKKI